MCCRVTVEDPDKGRAPDSTNQHTPPLEDSGHPSLEGLKKEVGADPCVGPHSFTTGAHMGAPLQVPNILWGQANALLKILSQTLSFEGSVAKAPSYSN